MELITRKYQISAVLSAITIVILAGVLLFTFGPTIDSLRLTTLANTPDSDVLTKLLLFSLKPIIWGFYILLSIFAVIFTVNSSRGVL